MRYRQFDPAPALRPYIAAYWMVKGHSPHLETVNILPDGCVDLILNLGEAVRSNHQGVVLWQEKPYLVGTFLQMKANYQQGEIWMLGIRFKPGGFPCFYKQDAMHEFANQIFEFESKRFPDLQKLIQSPVKCLNHFFLQRLNPPRHSLHPLLSDIYQSKGQTQVADLCKRHFITERQLERHFKQQVGYTPKAFINLTRFQHTFALIQNNPTGKSLMDIAFEAGYYDHAHLTNDIKRYLLATPASLAMSQLSQTVAEGKFQSFIT